MAFYLYRTRIKCLCRSYETIFWSFGFPILLSLFFYMGFNNLASHENIKTIPVAIVKESNADVEFIKTIINAHISNDKNLFMVEFQSLENAKVMLRDNKIAGYIVLNNKPALYFKNNGLEQSILKLLTDNYLQMSSTAKHISDLTPKAINDNFYKSITAYKDYIVDNRDEERNPDYTLIYFYTLIALACMFGTNWGFREMVDIQADQSAVGTRINITPVHKMKLLLCNILAAFTLHYLSILFLLTFLNKVLQIDFGHRIGMILLTGAFGSLCGISLGAMVCVFVKANVKVRGAILNAIVLGGGFYPE
ncbi:ABC transporter permease [Anaerocolumna sedimenticola]|uniref:ABC transporter permease n=1 Tax=Anaerocolumna sedimenticola TaxID=2696063 RepID=A0A6P1TTI4_9FIRM|nr:ABC transporter permease [Anaerocolumna sedimenticola]QHQ62808.1 ABC transporter permease [Anaerocolumna sedimenticola]